MTIRCDENVPDGIGSQVHAIGLNATLQNLAVYLRSAVRFVDSSPAGALYSG
jgi:hypothetical protein